MDGLWNLRHVRVFEAVARSGSFTKAAEHLQMTQPAVSRMVRQLEQDLQVVLFDPHDRRQLTEAGAVLLQHARLIHAQVQAASDAFVWRDKPAYVPATQWPRGLLHLAVVSPAHYFVPRMLKAFHAQFPEVLLKLTVARRSEILEMLLNHRLDIAITGYPPSDAELEAVHFARHPHVMVAPVAHPLVGHQQVTWDALHHSDVIFRERGSATRIFFEQIVQAKHMNLRKSLEMSTNEAVKQAVMHGMGISFLSAHVCQTEIQAGLMAVLDMVDMPKYIDWCLIHRRDSALSGVNLAFKQFVLNEGASYSECVLAPLPQVAVDPRAQSAS